MSLRSRFLVFLFSILGFFLIPLLFFGFFSVQKILQPRFYTKALVVSDIIPTYIELDLKNNKKVPDAIKENMVLAKEEINKTLQIRLFPQIETQIKLFVNYLRGKDKFPSFEFDMALFKKNLIQNMKDASKKQKFGDKFFVNSVVGFINGIPDIFDLQKYIDFSVLILGIEKHRPMLKLLFRYKMYFWVVPLIFLLLFFLSTFRIRRSFHYFSNLLLYSGFLFLLLFTLIFFMNPVVVKLTAKFLYNALPGLIYIPSPALIALQKYIVKTLALQGMIGNGILVVAGILLSVKGGKDDTQKQKVVVQHQFMPAQQPTIPTPPQY